MSRINGAFGGLASAAALAMLIAEAAYTQGAVEAPKLTEA